MPCSSVQDNSRKRHFFPERQHKGHTTLIHFREAATIESKKGLESSSHGVSGMCPIVIPLDGFPSCQQDLEQKPG